jgi:drug/metabolite transporter (DMT)-like permease
MLSIFIFVGIASAFARKAFDKDRNRYLWGTIGVCSYFLLQLLGGILIALIKPEWLENNGILTGISLLFGFIGAGIAYYILNNLSDTEQALDTDNQLLDSHLE